MEVEIKTEMQYAMKHGIPFIFYTGNREEERD